MERIRKLKFRHVNKCVYNFNQLKFIVVLYSTNIQTLQHWMLKSFYLNYL